ncbi:MULTISPECIES: DUF58 domain-containing protein [Pasteurellaceae]|uniref:DUF58 domain-containing protein n=1 Tax=Pasteurella atlantica TaxID=2827233 RepID=A0AAW8CMJ8_9PAST|nr:DUF58 domain-containing protein [Pasteurella atlantica]MBR0572631.1 DUF58 domain-containing protein [Pasteurella atlantica]MDP8038577.1 DUF58 domain-containing protein [Pasteurella atlantica]MDP8040669.1 DUF58 domain-containing protein [Pasteurella atlantica]MDP8042804.1 DUF58 domain-containing protein [Pasteurella atlantica]MDP8044891.1 DUF58 domain-containing protein [Pasteurella atlantica]
MTHFTGIVAELNELIQARPSKAVTGFAPSGKVSTHQWGSNRSIFKGRGMEFAESRGYQEGDDVRNIDWRVTARTGKTHTKLFQEERERPVHLLVDMRAMMKFGTRVRFKSNLAALISAELAWVGHDGGDRVGGQILTSDGIVDFRAARTRRAVLRFLEAVSFNTKLTNNPEKLQNSSEKQPLTLAQGIHRLRKSCRPGTLAFIISDFSDFDEQTAKELVRLATHTQVTTIQISDPLDQALPPQGRLSDGQSVVALGGLSKQQLASYEQAYRNRQQQLEKICRQNRIVIHQLQTSDDPSVILKPQQKSRRT